RRRRRGHAYAAEARPPTRGQIAVLRVGPTKPTSLPPRSTSRPTCRSSPSSEYSYRNVRSSPKRPSSPRPRRSPVACTDWSSHCTPLARHALRPTSSARSAAAREALNQANPSTPATISQNRVAISFPRWRAELERQVHGAHVLGQAADGDAVHAVLRDPAQLLEVHAPGHLARVPSPHRRALPTPPPPALPPMPARLRGVKAPDTSSGMRPSNGAACAIRTASRRVAASKSSTSTRSQPASSASRSCARVSTSTTSGRAGCLARAAAIAAATEPNARTWFSFSMTVSYRPMRWLSPPPVRTAYFCA